MRVIFAIETLILFAYSILFYSVPLGRHPHEPWHPFTSQANHAFVTYFRSCLYACIDFFLTSCRLVQRLANRRSLRTWDIATHIVLLVDLIFRRGFIREKSDFLMKFPTLAKFADVSQEYITRFAFASMIMIYLLNKY